MHSSPKDLEVKLKVEQSKAVIEGKTSVPFQTFVTLVLQRKVFPLFKKWSDEPVILSSELLTNMASAPQDSQENRSRLVSVTLAAGIIIGVLVFATMELLMLFGGVRLGLREYAVVVGGIVGLLVLARIVAYLQRVQRSDKLTETMEKLTTMISK